MLYTGVGKSCLLLRYSDDSFTSSFITTIGIDFKIKSILIDDSKVKLQIWDTAGQERFRSLIPGYLKDAHCALIIFDVTSKSTFADAESWVKLYTENRAGESFIFLVGNKIDR